MTNQPILTSPLDRLANHAPVRHDRDTFTDWIIRLTDWHLASETDAERDRR